MSGNQLALIVKGYFKLIMGIDPECQQSSSLLTIQVVVIGVS